MKKIQDLLPGCLYFNANIFSRQISKIANQAFSDLLVSPPHAVVMLLVYDNPGITPKELSQALSLSPSTITRFIDALIKKKLLTRKTHGKSAFIYATPKGNELKAQIANAWLTMYSSYTKMLGEKTAHKLSQELQSANEKL